MTRKVEVTQNKNKKVKILGHNGLSLIEILVALTLISLVLIVMPSNTLDQEHEELMESTTDIQKAIRYSIDESILRNSLTRITFDLDTKPVEYWVEYGPSGNFTLPAQQDTESMSLKEKEQYEKNQDKLSSKFNKPDELFSENKTLPESVVIAGVSTSYLNKVATEGKASIYFYPTGEKDSALIMISSPAQISTIEIPPFEDIISTDLIDLRTSELENLEDSLDNRAKELYEKWRQD